MEAGKKLINDIFNGNRILEIPFFQRAYVWSEPQWERMIIEQIKDSQKMTWSKKGIANMPSLVKQPLDRLVR